MKKSYPWMLVLGCAALMSTAACVGGNSADKGVVGGKDAGNGQSHGDKDANAPGDDASSGDLDADSDMDADSDSGNPWQFDGGSDACTENCVKLVDDQCGPVEICDDGLDNNCNGQVDEDCGGCTAGAVKPCFIGPPGRRGVGACTDGTILCEQIGEFTKWGECKGGMSPVAETCDNTDNDCNGCADDKLCCTPPINCPTSSSVPEGFPFVPYPMDGTDYYTGQASAWRWEVKGGPCDDVLGNTSFTLDGKNTSAATLKTTLSGDYKVKMEVDTAKGTLTCEWVVHFKGPGLRVELCWDTTGMFGTDIDLHLHNPANQTNWFTTPDDCYYMNCKAGAGTAWANWGYPMSNIANCKSTPGGLTWQAMGGCRNPRLDIDNISVKGKPENINVDAPVDGANYRVMVHYYGGSKLTHPVVNVYCQGEILGTYGVAPQVQGFTSGSGYNAGLMWRVVDVAAHYAGGVTSCDLSPLANPSTGSGYWVTNNDSTF